MSRPAIADVERRKFTNGEGYLIAEVLDDDLVHFEISESGNGPTADLPLYSSPMVEKTDYTGPSVFRNSGNRLETNELRIEIDSESLAVTIWDTSRGNRLLTVLRPDDLRREFKRLRINRTTMQHVYGLGQRFLVDGSADGDWTMLGVRESDGYGNGFMHFQDGRVGNVQIPIMYAIGSNGLGYALFLDNVYKQRWDFTKPTWDVQIKGEQIRFYIMSGPNLPDLRHDYMELTGRPPVPPRKAFGLWISEFGYDNWGQIDELKSGLRELGFPVEGFVLDLNWFGGIVLNEPSKSRMGSFEWDESASDENSYFFPNPGQRIKEYAADHVGLAVVEESYLANTTQTYHDIPSELCVFRRTAGHCDPAEQSHAESDLHGFWGVGRMIDWSDPQAGIWIHQYRRYPNLIKKGITVHWTDLGEPQDFLANGCYEGTSVDGKVQNEHADIHNLYNLFWNKSIWNGYFQKRGQADDLGRISSRPFILTRSGTAGSQRYGTAMWSGDIPGNLRSLATHSNAQMHMSFSGIDYYGADVGGYRREILPYNNKAGGYRGYEDEMYTQWLANACWFDIPIRPHTDNELISVNPPYATAPHLVGDRRSNLANLQRRYQLTPYYYSLAYRAYLEGEPVVPPLVFYYQDDLNVRTMGHQKLIGRDLLVASVAEHGAFDCDVYLPAGKWVNYYSNEWVASAGEVVEHVPTYRDSRFCLPSFARAGAILPQMHIDTASLDAAGHRRQGASPRNELILTVYASPEPSRFTLYEDDGWSLGYDAQERPKYHYRTTDLSQHQSSSDVVDVTISPAQDVGGTIPFDGAVNDRTNVVRLVVENARATSVRLNGIGLTKHNSQAEFDAAESGWYNAGENLILAKSDVMNVYSPQKKFTVNLETLSPKTSIYFVCDRGFTRPGQSIYVVGSIPEIGNWDVSSAVKLSPDVYFEYISNPPQVHTGPGPYAPLWTGVVSGLPANTAFEWKFVRMSEDGTGQVDYDPGPKHKFYTAKQGYSGRCLGNF
jgi:alpha-glucosidase